MSENANDVTLEEVALNDIRYLLDDHDDVVNVDCSHEHMTIHAFLSADADASQVVTDLVEFASWTTRETNAGLDPEDDGVFVFDVTVSVRPDRRVDVSNPRWEDV